MAAKYNLHTEILLEFESKDDLKEAKKYFENVGQNLLWNNLCNFVKNDLSEKFIKDLIECPTNSELIVQIGAELENLDKLDLISNVVLSETNTYENSPEIMSLKLKLLGESNDDRFLQLLKEHESVNNFMINTNGLIFYFLGFLY